MCWEWCGTPFGHKEDQAAIAKANTIHEGTGPAALVILLCEHLTPLGHRGT
jgi:hypothetical protein